MVKVQKTVFVSFPTNGISEMEYNEKTRGYFIDAIDLIKNSDESNTINEIHCPLPIFIGTYDGADEYNQELLLKSDYLYLGEGWENDKLCIRDYETAKNLNIKILKNKFIGK